MKWSVSLCNACHYAFDRVCDTTVSGMRWLGNFSSIAGGALSAVSFALDETLTVSYYLAANTSAYASQSFALSNFDESERYDFRFNDSYVNQGQFSETLSDHLNPFYLQMAAIALFCTGISLKSLSAIIGLGLRGLQERNYYKRNQKLKIPLPHWYEFVYVGIEASTESIAMSCATNAVLQSVLKFSPLLSTDYYYNYPSDSELSIKGDNFTGPVDTESFSFTRSEQNTFTINQGPISTPGSLSVTINGVTKVIYGAVLKLSSQGVNAIAIAPTAVASTAFYTTSTFFGDRARKAHNLRVINAGKKSNPKTINDVERSDDDDIEMQKVEDKSNEKHHSPLKHAMSRAAS